MSVHIHSGSKIYQCFKGINKPSPLFFGSVFLLYTALLITVFLPPAFAGDEKNIVPSVLKSATVYRNGAELTHAATATLKQGNNELLIDDISNTIDAASIRVGCTGDVTIMSVSFSTEYLKPATRPPFMKKLEDSAESVKKEMVKLEVLIKSDNELLELLRANKSIGGTQTGLSVAELVKMMDYYKQKSLELQLELAAFNDKWKRLDQVAAKLGNQIREEEKKNGKTAGRILLQLLSAESGSFNFTVSYLTPTAAWSPFYDLKVKSINDPLQLLYKAKLVQTTGIEWRQVRLTLSTSTPNQKGNAPELQPWFLGFVLSPYGLEGKLAGMVAPQSLNEAVVAGYSKAKKSVSAADLGNYITVNDHSMNVSFDIDIPYDVPGNGKEQTVSLKEYTVPAVYKYYSAPRLDKEAYLVGEVPGWEALNLLPGEANIIFEGSYVGKSNIDPNSTLDTLNLTLGNDKRVVVKREKLVDYSSVKFLGTNRKQVFTYEITIKNNKKQKLQMLLKDQYPLSTSKDIKTELLDPGGALVDEGTGMLTWNVGLAPGESKKYRISYSITSPKDKQLNIN